MRVQIHSQAEPPFVHELGFGVAPGFQTFVATQEQRVGSTHTQLIAFACCFPVKLICTFSLSLRSAKKKTLSDEIVL